MTLPGDPAVSVLIATRNRAASLAATLHSLDVAQATIAAPTEVVVIDNGSTDETATVLERWAAASPSHVTLRVEVPGKSRALNYALPRVRAPLLAFTDDDVEVTPTFLSAIVAFFAAHAEYAAAIGRVLPPAGPIDPQLLARIAQYRTIAFFDHGDAVRDESLLHGSNMVLRRTVFDTIGGFNETLGPGGTGGMEDQELGERLRRAGLRIGYMPEVVVHHAIDPSRLTPEYFRRFQMVQARSRLAMDPTHAWRRALPRLVESALGFAWWSLLAQPVRREHARGRLLRNAEILRLHWRRRSAAGEV